MENNKQKYYQKLDKLIIDLHINEFVSDENFNKKGIGEKEVDLFDHLEKARDIMKEINL